ncbi:MAG: RagB/SusD family nutrient uptake outer membrane protein [Filimonas sp.]|nr:RagB/SusD family nutrient uptake outer membrane protein [Filimonas sp.]
MKTVYKYSIALILLATAMSCSKSFLDKQPIGQIGRDGLFQDVQGARVALNGAYNRVAYYYAREFTLYGDVASDDVVVLQSSTGGSGQQLTMFDEYNFQSTRDGETSAVGHIWLNILEATNNINNIINAVPDLKDKYPKSKGELDSIMGQALILRALCHFDLSKVYAQQYKFTADASHLGVPVLLKTPSPKELIARKTMKETYAQIIADLKAGVDLLNQHPFQNRFAATSQAGMALLSRVYLCMGEWDNALDYANKVIQQGGFSLVSGNDYATMFLKDSVQSEMIFKLFCRKVQ